MKLMNTTRYQAHKLGFILGGALLAALTGCTTYVEERPREVYVPPEPAPVYVAPAPVVVETPAAPPVVAIQTEADFYQPLTPYGRWVDTPDYGRVWVPGGVAADWRPYCHRTLGTDRRRLVLGQRRALGVGHLPLWPVG